MKRSHELSNEETIYMFCKDAEAMGVTHECETCNNKVWCDANEEKRKAMDAVMKKNVQTQ